MQQLCFKLHPLFKSFFLILVCDFLPFSFIKHQDCSMYTANERFQASSSALPPYFLGASIFINFCCSACCLCRHKQLIYHLKNHEKQVDLSVGRSNKEVQGSSSSTIVFFFFLAISVCNLLIQVAVPVPQYYCLETKGSTGDGGENLTSHSSTQWTPPFSRFETGCFFGGKSKLDI